jgi:hypothetical protein
MTFIAVDILHNLVWMHDCFGFEENGRSGDSTQTVECAKNLVCFGEIFATCVYLLPDKYYGIHAEEFDTQVCKEQKLTRHSYENCGIGIVEIPLVVVEC